MAQEVVRSMTLPARMQLLVRLLCILASALVFSFLVTKAVLAPIGQWYESVSYTHLTLPTILLV